MFWSLQVLRRFPAVAAAVAGRFDEILVDEAQDTSELQLACLAELCTTDRLRSLVLVGDLEQSIYSFQGASPQALADLVGQRNLTPMSLVENHRSSQHLCDAAVHFCSRHEPDRAVGEYADHSDRPEILFYDRRNPGRWSTRSGSEWKILASSNPGPQFSPGTAIWSTDSTVQPAR